MTETPDDQAFDLDAWIDSATPVPDPDPEGTAAAIRRVNGRLERTHADLARASTAHNLAAAESSNRELRVRADLVIRCGDCNGRVIAHVTNIGGRPLLWAASNRSNSPGTRLFIDGDFWGATAWCRRREYVLGAAVLRRFLAEHRGHPPLEARVSHHGRTGAVR